MLTEIRCLPEKNPSSILNFTIRQLLPKVVYGIIGDFVVTEIQLLQIGQVGELGQVGDLVVIEIQHRHSYQAS